MNRYHFSENKIKKSKKVACPTCGKRLYTMHTCKLGPSEKRIYGKKNNPNPFQEIWNNANQAIREIEYE